MPLSGAFAGRKKLRAETEKFRAFAARRRPDLLFAAVRAGGFPLTAAEQIVAALGLTGINHSAHLSLCIG